MTEVDFGNPNMKQKSLRKTVDEMREGNVEPVYFLNGDDYFLQSLFVDEVMVALTKDEPPEKIYFSAESVDYTAAVADLFSGSLFGGQKLVIFHNPIRMSGKTKDDFFDYCRQPNNDNSLILILDKVDGRSAFTKNLSKIVPPINTSPPFPNKMADWIEFLLKKNGLSATTAAKELLLELSGDSVYHIANEIEKIKIGLSEDSEIEESHVAEYCGWEREYFPWYLSDAAGSKNLHNSILIGKSLIHHGVDVVSMVAQLATLFQELYLMSLPNGEDSDLPRTGWLNQILTRKLPIYFNNFSQNELEQIVKALGEADRNIKTGKGSGETLLVPLLHRIAVGYD